MTPSAPRLRLRIVATTDLHAHLAPFDYFRGDRDDGLGLAAAGALIEQARAEAANTLFFDNGDLLQGGPLGDFVASNGAAPGPHPMIGALSDLGCAAATLGNHDFDFGLDFLHAAIESAPFPFVTSNVTTPDGTPVIADHAVLERDFVDDDGGSQRIRIGVVGFVPPQVALWNKLHLDARVVVEDMVEAARRLIPLVRRRCDVLVALCHTGLSRRPCRPGDENAALAIARLGGIDAMVMGHQHLLFPGYPDFAGIEDVDTALGTIAGVPATMPGSAGGQVGIVDLVLHREGGRWVRASAHSSLRSSRELGQPPSPTVLAASAAWHEGTLAFVKRPVGRVANAITSHFGLVEDCGAVQIVNDAQRWFVATVAGDLGLAGLPILSACAPFRCGGRGGPSNYTNVVAGPVTLRDIADIYPFPNTLCILKVTGSTVQDWLEKSACLYRTIDVTATAPQQLTDPAFPSFDFDVIDGVDYTIDVTRPPRFDAEGRLVSADHHRVVGPTFAGSPLREQDTFLIATNNYRAFGGGGFPGLDGSQVVHVAAEPSRDVLARYIAAHPGVDATPDHNWRLAPLPPHVVALVRSAPDILPSRTWRRTGVTAGGFDEFQLVAES